MTGELEVCACLTRTRVPVCQINARQAIGRKQESCSRAACRSCVAQHPPQARTEDPAWGAGAWAEPRGAAARGAGAAIAGMGRPARALLKQNSKQIEALKTKRQKFRVECARALS